MTEQTTVFNCVIVTMRVCYYDVDQSGWGTKQCVSAPDWHNRKALDRISIMQQPSMSRSSREQIWISFPVREGWGGVAYSLSTVNYSNASQSWPSESSCTWTSLSVECVSLPLVLSEQQFEKMRSAGFMCFGEIT